MSTPESKFQSEVLKYLRHKGCIALKQQMNATTRAGTPDIIFMKEGFWGAIECKASKNAKFRPNQKEMIEKMNEWSWAVVAYPENWGKIKEELEGIL